ncbi:cytochrome c-type biogenesis CcmF C-terminal domain-containing protein [Micromonospora sp. NPDC049559]|uniref:heme lyase CcmF/NrfE family subunit n=1 Tax=Micromonospora sp. NPDC049559 TaxID=3155923 RepID=UPI003443B5D6
MTGQLGAVSLGAGVAASVAATLLWLRLALAPDAPRSAVRAARLATGACLLAAALACGALEWALLRHDLGIRFVAENGGRQVPTFYTVTSLWSALDGSLLLWLLILCGYAALLGRTAPAGDPRPHRYAMTVVGTVAVFFFALSYFAANPFQAVHPVPADGPGPNPLLRQHPAMGLHPPLLYAGYLGLVVPFGYALAGLVTGGSGTAWIPAARSWTLRAWALLTAGIALGAWWSYAVLGWGGYWAWDPVENASLLPWLTSTAFLHVIRSGRAGRGGAWPAALASASFLLVLVGTFLTRSGVVESVHAFTESALGPMLLGFTLVAATGTVVLIGWRAERPYPPPEAQPPAPALASRGAALLGNRLLLTSSATVLLVGTLFPAVVEAVTGTRAAVGPAYFDRTVVPLVIALLALMGLAPRPGHDRPGPVRRVAVPAGAALATVAVVGLASRPGPMALAAFGCAAFALTATAGSLTAALTETARAALPGERRGRQDPRRRLAGLWGRRRAFGGPLAHAGIALVAIGVTASSAYPASAERELAVGQSVRVGDASARLVAVDRSTDGNAMRVRARLAVSVAGRPERPAVPALLYYPRRDLAVSVPAIRGGPLRDTYATVVAVSADGGSATIRLAVNPMVRLIWAGAALTALGGLLAAGRRRGAPRPPRPALGRPPLRRTGVPEPGPPDRAEGATLRTGPR